MELDKSILDMIGSFTLEEKNAIISALQTSRTNPEMLVIMGIFRDMYVFKQMINAIIVSYMSEVQALKRRIEELE